MLSYDGLASHGNIHSWIGEPFLLMHQPQPAITAGAEFKVDCSIELATDLDDDNGKGRVHKDHPAVVSDSAP